MKLTISRASSTVIVARVSAFSDTKVAKDFRVCISPSAVKYLTFVLLKVFSKLVLSNLSNLSGIARVLTIDILVLPLVLTYTTFEPFDLAASRSALSLDFSSFTIALVLANASSAVKKRSRAAFIA